MASLLTFCLMASLGLMVFAEEEACWESCFKHYDDEKSVNREIYDNLLQIAHEITALKNIYGIGKLGFALHSSLSSRHNVHSKEIPTTTEGAIIFATQSLIGKALEVMVNGNYKYAVQFNEAYAWGCDEHSCLTTCRAVFDTFPTPPEMGPTSHCLGNVEAACKLLNNYMTTYPCADTTGKSMVIAIVNDDFYLNDDQKHKYDNVHDHMCPPQHWHGLSGRHSSSSSSEEEYSFSPCLAYFDTRYIIAVNSPTKEVMERFPSKHGNYRYFHDSPSSLFALNELLRCMGTACCSGTEPRAPTVCSKTQGPYGEIISDYPNHPSIPRT